MTDIAMEKELVSAVAKADNLSPNSSENFLLLYSVYNKVAEPFPTKDVKVDSPRVAYEAKYY